VQYLNTRREESDSLVQEAIDKRYPDAARGPTVHDYRNGCGVFDWGNGRHETRQIREALDSISK
jgi:hypothetical protein